MIYINNSKQPVVTYDEAVRAVVAGGVEPKRAYVYLMAFGVKGERGRVMGTLDYSPVVKLAVKDGKVIKSLSICKTCKGLVVVV